MSDMTNIVVLRSSENGSYAFDVRVEDANGESRHDVTLAHEAYERLTAGKYAPETCVEAAFHFLLDRESKESILARFDVSVAGLGFTGSSVASHAAGHLHGVRLAA